MPYESTIDAVIRSWQRRIERVPASLAAMQAQWGEDVKRKAMEYSSGTISEEDLRAIRIETGIGLYSVRRSDSFLIDSVVNKQTGEFLFGWRAISRTDGRGVILTAVLNVYRPKSRMRIRPALDRAVQDAAELFPMMVRAVRAAERV